MDREQLKNLRVDRRLVERRGWISKVDLREELDSLPDVSHKIDGPAGGEPAASAESAAGGDEADQP